MLNLEWGVTGVAGPDALLARFSTMGISSCSAMTTSNTSLASATLFLRTSALNRHNAHSLLERLMSRSVISAAFFSSSLMTTAIRWSFSDVPGMMEPNGDEVRGGVERDAERESGVKGCSGADGVVFRALGSSNLESCEAAGEGEPTERWVSQVVAEMTSLAF